MHGSSQAHCCSSAAEYHMVGTSRACYSLALLAWSNSHRGTAFSLVSSSSLRTTNSALGQFVSSSSTTNSNNMSIESTDSDVATNLNTVLQNIQSACEDNGRNVEEIRLVAVSKTKPSSLLMDAYKAGQRYFGENYVQELVGKAEELPNDIHWHFIGPLQSNKANLLVKSVVPNAASLTVETVSTLKLANKLNNAMAAVNEESDDDEDKKLSIFIQVNTSGEDTKSGVEPSEVAALCQDIVAKCPLLAIQGLMTIGAPGDYSCFDTLRECRDEVQVALGMESLELSMGMSGDYQQAIAQGATNVRVGSTIFGARDYSNKK